MTEPRVDQELLDEERVDEGTSIDRAGLFTPHRLFGLTDGVFAIAMTLLALDVRVPDDIDETVHGFGGVAHAFYADFFVFLVAFAITGRFWMISHRTMARLKAVDEGVLNRTISFLAGISSIPVATAVLFRFGSVPQAVTFASVLLAATSLLSARLWWYLSAPERQLLEPAPDPDARLDRLLHLLWSPPIYLLAVPIAYLLENSVSGDDKHVGYAMLTWLLLAGDGVFVRLVHRFRVSRAS